MLESDDNMPSVFRKNKLLLNTHFIYLKGIDGVKSFVDDFDWELGTVRVRVGWSYDPLRLSPCSGDLYANCADRFDTNIDTVSHPNSEDPSLSFTKQKN